MTRRIFAVVLLSVSLVQLAFAEVIELKDGAKITGTVESLNNGVYQIKSPSLGEINVNKDQVVAIYQQAPEFDSAKLAKSMDSIRQKVEKNPGIMLDIMALQNEPEVQAILKDPKIMEYISTGNFGALMNDPKVRSLMNNQKVKSLTGDIKGAPDTP